MKLKCEIQKFDGKGMSKLEWSDLDDKAKRWIIGAVVYEVVEKLVVWHFIYHTPKDRTRGSKWTWFGLSFINFFGPLAYALFGRKNT